MREIFVGNSAWESIAGKIIVGNQLMGKSCLKSLWENPMRNSCGKGWRGHLVGPSCRIILVQNSCRKSLQ